MPEQGLRTLWQGLAVRLGAHRRSFSGLFLLGLLGLTGSAGMQWLSDPYRFPLDVVEVKGEFAHFLDDPYAEPGFEREPLFDEVEVLVVGGGFGGLLAGARLRQAGVEDIRIVDPASDFGGTWYWNRYPGIACDIESYTYLPLLEEISGTLGRLPVALSTALFGSMLKGIDFVTSNVPGPRFEVYASGARIERIFGFGPLSGAGANITLFSYDGEQSEQQKWTDDMPEPAHAVIVTD